jgi:hypothetical protein
MAKRKITLGEYRNAAKRMYHDEGTLELDDTPKVSKGDDAGAYVQAWVWVSDSDIQPEDKIKIA